jgi:hypothetical protein
VSDRATLLALALLLSGCGAETGPDVFEVDVRGKDGSCYTVRRSSDGFAKFTGVMQQDPDKCRSRAEVTP